MTKHADVTHTIASSVSPCLSEKVPLLASPRRVLHENIFADMDMPPFDKSAIDGYACRKEDLENKLELLEIIRAGELPAKIIGKNQCSKIMTGAAVPEGADCVFMLEESITAGEKIIKCNNPKTKTNICYKGEDYKRGDLLIS